MDETKMKSYVGVLTVDAIPEQSPDNEDGYMVYSNGIGRRMEAKEFHQTFIPIGEDTEGAELVKRGKIPDIAFALKDEKIKHETAKALTTALQKRMDVLSLTVLPELLEEQGIESMVVAGLGRVQVTADIRCSVLADNRVKLEKWLTDNGHESLIGSTVNASTLKAFIKEMIKNKESWPTDIVKVEPYYRTSIVKA